MQNLLLKSFLNLAPSRLLLGMFGLLLLISVYLLQRWSVYHLVLGLTNADLPSFHPYVAFVVNKTSRLILNDIACFMLISAVFVEKKYLRVAFFVFLFELLVILPAYFAVKLSLEGDSEISSPLLSQIHRMIVNPTLMFLLIVGFFLQKSGVHE